MSRIKVKVSNRIQTILTLICSHVQIQSPALCWPQVAWDWIWPCEHVKDPNCLTAPPCSQSLQLSKTYLETCWTPWENWLSWESKLIKKNPFKPKKAKSTCFLGLTAPLQKKYNSIPHFFLKILKAVCPGFVHIHKASTYSNHRATICSTLWDSHGGAVLQSLIFPR